MKKHLTAWSPAVVALVSGLVAWIGAFSDRDAFAVRALSASVVLTALASALAWVRAWNGIGLAATLGAKAAAVLLLAPDGFSTLLQSYEQASRRFESHLVYFWAMPPVMLAITIVEGWFLGVVLSKKTIRETKLWARRYPLGITFGATVTVIAAWLGFRVEYYLWRMRSDDAPASYSLSKVGPRALPRIYREIHDLGMTACGSYRSDLVDVIKDVRQRQVADAIGSPLVWEVEATLTEPEPAMVDALRTAFTSEPNTEARNSMANWSSELDFNTVVSLFCEVFTSVPPESRDALLGMIDAHVRRAYGRFESGNRPPRHDPSYPWGELDDATIARTQAAMRNKLACVPPLVLGALEEAPPDKLRWQAIAILARMHPLEPAHAAHLVNMVEHPRDPTLVQSLLDKLGPGLTGGDAAKLNELVVASYLATKPRDARTALAYWAMRQKQGFDPFFCSVFAKAPAEDRTALVHMLALNPRHDACVATALMRSYEELALDEGHDDPLGRMTIERSLADLIDDRVQPWAAALVKRLPKDRVTHRLESLARPSH